MLVDHITCEYFLPICMLHFHFVYCFLGCAKAFEFMLVPFVYFCFYFHYSGIWIEKDTATIYVRECSAYVCLQEFYILGHTFRSLIHFEFIFVYGVKKWSSFIFLTCSCLVFPAPFVEKTVFLILCSLASLCAKSLQLCQTLCDPMDWAYQAPLSMRFSRQENWSALPFPSPGDLPDPGIRTAFPVSPVLASWFFTTSTTWKALSVQFSHSVVSNSLQPHGLQHARIPCPSSTPRVCSNTCLSSWWCHPTISSSVIPSPPPFNLSQHQSLFLGVSSSHQVAKVLEFQFQHQSFQWIFRTDFF